MLRSNGQQVRVKRSPDLGGCAVADMLGMPSRLLLPERCSTPSFSPPAFRRFFRLFVLHVLLRWILKVLQYALLAVLAADHDPL